MFLIISLHQINWPEYLSLEETASESDQLIFLNGPRDSNMWANSSE